MSSTTGHDHDAEPAPPRVQEVSDGVFAYVQPDGTAQLPRLAVSSRT